MIEGNEVIHELRLPVPPDEAFEMFVDPVRLIRWIGISAELEPRPGGRFRFEVMPGQFCEGRYESVDRPRRLVFTWGWTAESARPSRPSRENPASIPRTVRTGPNECGRHHASDQRFRVHKRPPGSAEIALWTAEKREVIGSMPIPATCKSPAQQGFY